MSAYFDSATRIILRDPKAKQLGKRAQFDSDPILTRATCNIQYDVAFVL